jgi:hypothetical protein
MLCRTNVPFGLESAASGDKRRRAAANAGEAAEKKRTEQKGEFTARR